MRSIVLKFGLISAFILAGGTALTLPLVANGTIDFTRSQLLGYSIMVLSFIPAFLGVRAVREDNGGTIGFWRAFGVAMLIALVSTLCYVAVWQVIHFGGFLPGFVEKMQAIQIGQMQAKGASPEAIAQSEKFWELYKTNPLVNIAITLLEPLPVALIVSFVAAAILRRRPGAATVATA